MNKTHRYLGSILLSVTFVAPLALGAMVGVQDKKEEKREEKQDKREEKARERYYDKHHKDYHEWDDSEDRHYHTYLTERHHPIVEFRAQKEKERQRYWKWRHEHPDHDNR